MKRKLLSDNPNEVLRILFHKFGLKYDAIAQQAHKNHPLYPSFNSIAYVLSLYGIESCLIETCYDEIPMLPGPLVIYYDGLFLPLAEVTDGEIAILNEQGKSERQPRTMLQHLWTKTALIFDADKIIKRKSSLKERIRFYFNKTMLWVFVASIVVVLLLSYGAKANEMDWQNYAFLTTGAVGIIIGVLFQVQEFDRSNKFVNSICHSKHHHSNRDCSSILDSRDAKFLGLFSWADFGLLYFSFLMLLPLFFKVEVALSVTILLSLPAALYIPYSLIYQWQKARKWCALCLMIQGVLFANFILAVFGLFLHGLVPFLDMDFALRFLLVGIFVTASFTSGKIGLKTFLNNRSASKLFGLLKHDYAIRNLLLEKGKHVSVDNLDMLVVNPEGAQRLTVVFSPVCSPCIRKLSHLLEFWDNKRETRLELIFLLDQNDPLAHITAVELISHYCQDRENFPWFLKDYVSHFPSSRFRCALNNTDEYSETMIKTHDEWCTKNGITSTPTMFLDGMEIPSLYSINDIDYMIN